LPAIGVGVGRVCVGGCCAAGYYKARRAAQFCAQFWSPTARFPQFFNPLWAQRAVFALLGLQSAAPFSDSAL